MKRYLALPLACSLAGCLTHPAPPPPPYHAVGTEPFWNLLIDEHNLTFADGTTPPGWPKGSPLTFEVRVRKVVRGGAAMMQQGAPPQQ